MSQFQVSSDSDAKVKGLERELLETRMLYTSTLQDFEIVSPVAGHYRLCWVECCVSDTLDKYDL